MKKIFKFRTMLIAIITVLSFIFLFSVDNTIVSAEEGYGNCTTTNGALSADKGACKIEDFYDYGTVTITKEGMINVTYNHGITEFIVYAEACAAKEVDEAGNITCKDNAWTGKKYVIHASGSHKGGYKTIHLFKYFDTDQLVRVNVLYEFLNSSGTFGNGSANTATSGTYNPLYCDLNVARYECGKYFSNNDSDIKDWKLIKSGVLDKDSKVISQYSIKKRVELIGDLSGVKYTLERVDRNGIVYEGSSLQTTFTTGGVYVVVAATGADEAQGNLDQIIYDTVIPALLIILGIAATITVVVLGVQIVKGADEASERSEKIKHLRSILIGLAIAFSILVIIEPVAEFISRYME